MSRSTPLRGDAPAFYPSNNPPHASRHVAPAQASNLPYYSHHSASAHPVSIPYYAHHFAGAHPVNPSYSPHYVAPAQSLIPAQLPQAITPIHFPNPTHSFHHVAPVQHHHLPKLAPRPPYQQHSQPSDFIPPRPIGYPRTRKYPAQPAAFFQRHLPPPPVSLRPIPGPPLPPPRPSRPLIYVPPPRPGPSRLSTQPPPRAPRLFPKTNNRLMPPTRQPQCAFLARLPGELRNKIYKLTLISHELIRAVRSIDDDNEKRKKKAKHRKSYASNVPALAQTCSQIRRECLGVYYASNAFVFEPEIGCADILGAAVDAGVVHGWVRSLTLGGWEREVSRVGCVWKRFVVEDGKVVGKDVWIVATLVQNDEEYQIDAEAPKPRVTFETNLTQTENICVHLLDGDAMAFERRRAGKSVRGYGALIDIALTVCNYLAPFECGHYPRGCPGCSFARVFGRFTRDPV